MTDCTYHSGSRCACVPIHLLSFERLERREVGGRCLAGVSLKTDKEGWVEQARGKAREKGRGDGEKREKAEIVLVMVVERRSGWEREGG